MKKFWTTLNGHSMSPLLRDLDKVLIEPVAPSALKCGDIVLFLDLDSRELTLHRLISSSFDTKGDYSLYLEANSQDAFIGKAIGFSRDDFYRELPAHGSFFNKCFIFLSKLRMRGLFLRRISRLLQIILTKVFEFCT